MKKLVLIVTTFILTTIALSQEQKPQKVQQLKTSKDSVHNQQRADIKHLYTETNETEYPITYTVGSNSEQRIVGNEKTLEDFNAYTIDAVNNQLKEIYGQYYEQYGFLNIIFYASFYDRCEFIPLSNAPSGIKNISSLSLKDKYNPKHIYHDNTQKFNAEKFNVLKYQFDYYNKSDQYFRIYNTDMVLKINKLN